MKHLGMKEKSKKNSGKRKGWLITGGIFLIIAITAVICLKKYAVDSFTDHAFTIYIRPATTYQELLDTLKTKVDKNTYLRFCRMSRLDDYERKMRPGAYRLDPSMSAVDVYKILSRGLQTPVRFSFNNIRTPQQFAGKAAQQLMMDSSEVMKMFADTAFIRAAGFTKENFESMLLPDSYEFYWTITPRELFNRFQKEYQRFWTDERREKAQAMGFSPVEISIIASIAEEETNDPAERGIVGRLYLNRLQINMPLQADPTVKFALQDFSLRRILNQHLQVDSPYNTYKYAGLPPGPIRIPTKKTIDTILNSEPHAYIYMCAKEDFSGRHNFATSYSQHQLNAARYRKALNERNIR
ncbi:MAG: endolytic transglycosylase MltG [Bacteroidales bacterium]